MKTRRLGAWAGKYLAPVLVGSLMAIKAGLRPVRFLVPERLRKRMVSLLLGRYVEQLPSREFLDTGIVSALAASGAKRILFVGTQRYNQKFFRHCEVSGLTLWSLDVDAAAAGWGVPTRHMVGDVREVDRLAAGLTFDAVVFNGIFGFGIDSLEDATRAIHALARVMADGGVLVVGWNPGLTADFCQADAIRGLLVPAPLGDLPAHTEFGAVAQVQVFPHVYDIYRVRPAAPGARTIRRAGRIRARQIADADVGGVVDLLAKGFRRRSPDYWRQALHRLAGHHAPEGQPKYGYLMERDGVPVGVILLISSAVPAGNGSATRCNVSSWHVDPALRSYAPLLVSQALKRADVTYLNISSEPFTRPIIEAQGFSRYSNGQFITAALPALFGRSPARLVDADADPDAPCEPYERELLAAHARYGCWSFWCTTPDRAYPFVFVPRVVKSVVPCAQLVYCRDIADVATFVRPIGSYLASRGRFVIVIDANGPIHGLRGKYVDGAGPKYFKGPQPPRLGDLAYTEAAMFGM